MADKEEKKLAYDLNIDLHTFYNNTINSNIDWKYNKPFLQLFCFTLSSLNILNAQLSDKNLAILKKILNFEIKEVLKNKNVDRGDAGSGNHSMFYAIFNIYANEFLNLDRNKQIQEWLDFNINSINSNGFWGIDSKMDYLQFQNGYHQYEIFEYLKIKNKSWNIAAKKTLMMGDKLGHFAPWPGGGACYDYDAIFMLTSKFVDDVGQENVLKTTLNTIVSEQDLDGGFCESIYMKNNLLFKFSNVIKHILSQPNHIKIWCIFVNLNLFRYKHRNIATHWSQTNRKWDSQMLGIHFLDYRQYIELVIV